MSSDVVLAREIESPSIFTLKSREGENYTVPRRDIHIDIKGKYNIDMHPELFREKIN